MFYERLSFGDANDQDKDIKNTKIKKNTKCFKDTMYSIFLESRGFQDFTYDARKD